MPNKTEGLNSAPDWRCPGGSLSSPVKPTLSNLGVFMGRALNLDQHIYCVVHSCFYELRDNAKERPILPC